MYRFPNPSSNIDHFIDVFNAIYNEHVNNIFKLEDIIPVVIQSGLATSSGHSGKKAIELSNNPDKSRDRLYNQMKMYSELFRLLGWIGSNNKYALEFVFTLLGKKVAESGSEWRPILGESVLGIATPTNTIKQKNNKKVRPFATILRTMTQCKGELSRDEMILGPLSLEDDRIDGAITSVSSKILDLRHSKKNLDKELEKLAKRDGVQVNTMKNYTRWPLSVLLELDWVWKDKKKNARRAARKEVYRMTEKGSEIAIRINNAVDIRSSDIGSLSETQLRALVLISHREMLKRAGIFELPLVESLSSEDSADVESIFSTYSDKVLLFSPYQTLSNKVMLDYFDYGVVEPIADEHRSSKKNPTQTTTSRELLTSQASFENTISGEKKITMSTELAFELRALMGRNSSLHDVAGYFAQSRRNDKQKEFYALITSLFRIIGYNSDTSRAGVNYQRFDAWVELFGEKVPIEIKSPTEELALSTKSVRQALENKVIQISREHNGCSSNYSSLIVGYNLPNVRSDVWNLIDDIYYTYKIKVGLLDVRTLVILALHSLNKMKKVSESQLANLKGTLNVTK